MKQTWMPNWQDEDKTDVLDQTEGSKSIILYNDDYNHFDHVIKCLIDYCKHSKEQANQVALIVHNNGKCDVKRGSFNELMPIYEALLDNHLSCNIE